MAVTITTGGKIHIMNKIIRQLANRHSIRLFKNDLTIDQDVLFSDFTFADFHNYKIDIDPNPPDTGHFPFTKEDEITDHWSFPKLDPGFGTDVTMWAVPAHFFYLDVDDQSDTNTIYGWCLMEEDFDVSTESEEHFRVLLAENFIPPIVMKKDGDVAYVVVKFCGNQLLS